MAATLVGTASLVAPAAASTYAVPMPSGSAAGDLVIVVGLSTGSITITPPDGTWTTTTSYASGTSGAVPRTTAFYKTLAGTASSTYTFSASAASAIGGFIAYIFHKTTGAWSITVSGANSVISTTVTAPSLSLTGPGFAIATANALGNTGYTLTPPASPFVEAVNRVSAGTTNPFFSSGYRDYTSLSGTNTVGGWTFTSSNSVTNSPISLGISNVVSDVTFTGVTAHFALHGNAGSFTLAGVPVSFTGATAHFALHANAGSSGVVGIPITIIGVTAYLSLHGNAGAETVETRFFGETAQFNLSANSGGVFIPPVIQSVLPFEPPIIPAVYTFELCDPYTGQTIAELTDASNKTVTLSLRGSSSAQFSLSIYSEQAGLISPIGTGLKVYRDDILIFRGIVGPTQGSKGAGNKHDITYVAFDYRGLLKRYQIWPEDYAAKVGYYDDAGIVGWNLIDTVQKRGNSLGIQLSGDGSVGQSGYWKVDNNSDVASAIQKMADSGDTFDWDITDDGEGNMIYEVWPVRGVLTEYALEPGGSLLELSYTYQPEQYANVIRVQGAGGLVSTVISTNIDTSIRYEMTVSDDSLKTQDAVDNRAKGLLKLHEELIPTYTAKIASKYWSPEQLWLGDAIFIDILPERNDEVRVQEISLGIGPIGEEQISITFGRVLSNFLIRTAEAYEKASRAQSQVTTKITSFISLDDPGLAAATGDVWLSWPPDGGSI